MTTKPDGGPAFARAIGYGTLMVAGEPSNIEVAPQAGMSLRDYFAGQALAAWCDVDANGVDYSVDANSPSSIAEWCYEIADAMLAEREK